jgi:hypothetical protein
MKHLYSSLLLGAFLVNHVRCLTPTKAAPPVCPMDPSSFANCEEVQTFHFQLDVYVDFNQSSIQGYNTMNLTAVKDSVSQVVLDYQGMDIIDVA